MASTPCWAFQEGRCRRPKCPYDHVLDDEYTVTACKDFARGRCNKGGGCPLSHDPADIATLKLGPVDATNLPQKQKTSPTQKTEPGFQRQACRQYAKGKCFNGDNCRYSHDDNDMAALKASQTDPFCEADAARKAADEDMLRKWRYFIPRDSKKPKKLGIQMSNFCEMTCHLALADAEIMQMVISALAEDGGMLCIVELMNQPFDTLSASQLARVFDQHLLPFFKAISNTNVRSSASMEERLGRICQYIYGPGGQRAVEVFGAVARHLATLQMFTNKGSLDTAVVAAFEYSLGTFSMMVAFVTSAQANEALCAIVETVSVILQPILPDPTPFGLQNTRKHFVALLTRFGKAAPLKSHQAEKSNGARAVFELEPEKPGELSPQGRRHDNDHEDIRSIQIMPTIDEITSSRSEYLPTNDPSDWHLPGLQGLIDK